LGLFKIVSRRVLAICVVVTHTQTDILTTHILICMGIDVCLCCDTHAYRHLNDTHINLHGVISLTVFLGIYMQSFLCCCLDKPTLESLYSVHCLNIRVIFATALTPQTGKDVVLHSALGHAGEAERQRV
jgi:hypothetical protein